MDTQIDILLFFQVIIGSFAPSLRHCAVRFVYVCVCVCVFSRRNFVALRKCRLLCFITHVIAVVITPDSTICVCVGEIF